MEKDDRYTRITLRIPRDLHELLGSAATKTSKSMNAEIIARLEASFISETNMDRPVHGISVSDDGTERTLYSGPSPKEMFRVIADLAEQVRLLREGNAKE